MTAFQFGHERGGQRRLALGRLGHWREVGLPAASLVVLLRVGRITTIQTADLLATRVVLLLVVRSRQVKLASHVLLWQHAERTV